MDRDDNADLKKYNSGIHKENGARRRKGDEQCTQNIQQCLQEFGSDPFDLTNTALRTLHSGQLASEEMVEDFSAYLRDGEMQLNSFFQQRIFSKAYKFDDIVHRNDRKTFINPGTSKKGITKQMKTAAMENKAMTSVVSMCCKDKAIPLMDVMKHRITEECLSVFNCNGTLVKNDGNF